MSKKNLLLKKRIYTAGIIVGAIIMMAGLSMAMLDIKIQTMEQAFFRADYYTESYAAMAASANNLCDLITVVQNGFIYLICSIGAFDICYFISKRLEVLAQISDIEESDNISIRENEQENRDNDINIEVGKEENDNNEGAKRQSSQN